MLSEEDIKMAYRFFLGREPENKDVILNLQQNIKTYDDLSKNFLISHEFVKIYSKFIGEQQNIRLNHPLLPRIPVDVDVSLECLQNLLHRVHLQWHKLGKENPYWSVLTQEQYKNNNFDNNRSSFYSSGKYFVDVFMASLRRASINIKNIKSCIDFGCGVGRVTFYLSKNFPMIYGIDISENHLNIARNYLLSKDVSNVELIHALIINDFESMPKVDAIFSVITLQHNPPPVIKILFQILLRHLTPKGIAYIQLPTYKNGYMFEIERYLNSADDHQLEMHFIPQIEIYKIIDQEGCVCLEVREDGMVSDEMFSISQTFLIQKKS